MKTLAVAGSYAHDFTVWKGVSTVDADTRRTGGKAAKSDADGG
ncbi:HofP DNA utilization family protein [Escherichia sp. R-CC3]